jgi:NTE family protein
MLRKYAWDVALEQLPIPLSTVSVDLISGTQIVHDTGDVVQAVLESINLPFISRPILRDGMALIDGGVLNNLPGDLLPERGADFVVGIDIVARLRGNFAGNAPDTPTAKMRPVGPLQALFRIAEIQAFHMTALRNHAVDLLITPDTTDFDFADFSRANEIADAGEAAAQELLPRLTQMLADLERS